MAQRESYPRRKDSYARRAKETEVHNERIREMLLALESAPKALPEFRGILQHHRMGHALRCSCSVRPLCIFPCHRLLGNAELRLVHEIPVSQCFSLITEYGIYEN
jgi:hypothetical protein